jgi:hypothetical protein
MSVEAAPRPRERARGPRQPVKGTRKRPAAVDLNYWWEQERQQGEAGAGGVYAGVSGGDASQSVALDGAVASVPTDFSPRLPALTPRGAGPTNAPLHSSTRTRWRRKEKVVVPHQPAAPRPAKPRVSPRTARSKPRRQAAWKAPPPGSGGSDWTAGADDLAALLRALFPAEQVRSSHTQVYSGASAIHASHALGRPFCV